MARDVKIGITIGGLNGNSSGNFQFPDEITPPLYELFSFTVKKRKKATIEEDIQ
jgi:hypothetical protein